jgi:hypothetical protein
VEIEVGQHEAHEILLALEAQLAAAGVSVMSRASKPSMSPGPKPCTNAGVRAMRADHGRGIVDLFKRLPEPDLFEATAAIDVLCGLGAGLRISFLRPRPGATPRCREARGTG